jgi:hypothetical protein
MLQMTLWAALRQLQDGLQSLRLKELVLCKLFSRKAKQGWQNPNAQSRRLKQDQPVVR